MRRNLRAIGNTIQVRTCFVLGLLCLALAAQGQVTDGLVAYYPFNGNANDQSGNSNHGTVIGATLVADRFGSADHAYQFNGSSDHIYAATSPPLEISGDITVAVWAKYTGIQNAGIISKYSGVPPVDAGWTLGMNSCCDPGKVGFGGRDHSNTFWHAVSPGNFNDDQWHFFVGQRSGDKWRLFADGTQVSEVTATGAGDISTGNLLVIGLLGTAFFNGVIDDIRIYNRALSSSEISELFSPTPRVITFSPTSGPAGTTVTITGTNFSTTPQDNAVFFGTARATVTSATTTTLTVLAPGNTTFAPLSVSANGVTSYATRGFNLTFPGDPASNPSFSSSVSWTLSGEPGKVVIGDLNGDGKADLAIANYGSGMLTLMENIHTTGAITTSSFASPVNLTTGGTGPYGVAIGDINGDGKPDIAMANRLSNNVSLFENVSNSGSLTTGSFAAHVTLTTGDEPHDVAIYDLDLDGKPDIITSNSFGESVSVIQNQMTGTTITTGGFAAKVDLAAGGVLSRLAVRDLDADNRPEIVAANDELDQVSVFKNLSTPGTAITSGSFQAKVDFATGTDPENVAIGDLNSDGKPDMATANSTTNNVSIFVNNSTAGTINASSFTATVFGNHAAAHGVSLGELNGDGKPDLAVVYHINKQVGVRRNNFPSSPLLFTRVEFPLTISGTSDSESTAIGDLDGDTKPDIVVANFTAKSISALQNLTAVTEPTSQPTSISFSSVTHDATTVSFTAASTLPTGYIGLRRDGTSPTDIPVDGTTYIAGSGIGSSTVAFVGTGTSFNVTGLSPTTLYFYDIFSYNAAGAYNYLTSSPLEGSRATIAEPPSAQPTDIAFSSITHEAMTVSFTAPGVPPTGYIALINPVNSPVEIPNDEATYSQGDFLGTNTTVAYVGTGTSFPLTGLPPSTTHYFAIFSYNGTTGTYNYLTSTPLTGSQTTYADPPTAQPTDISFSSITDVGMTVNFNAASPAPTGYIAVMSATGSPTGTPENGTSYSLGDLIGGRPVVFIGTGNSFSVTSLSPSTIHYFDIFSYNGTTGTYNYLTSSPLEGSQTTYAELPTAQPADIAFASISNTDLTVSFTAAAGPPTGYIGLMNATGSPTEIPANGTTYNIGDLLGTNTLVAYIGSNSSFPVSGLSPSTIYYFDIFSYNGVTGTYHYLTTSPLEGSQTTYADPPSGQPTDIGFSSVSDDAMTVTFTAASGSPTGYLALINTTASPTEIPVNGTEYDINDALGVSTVAYIGPNASFPVAGLSPATTYYFDIFSYNGTTGTYNYLTSAPLEGSQTTLSIPSAQPTGIIFSAVADDRMTVEFTAATGSPTGYIGLLSTSGSPADVPVSGNTYTAGNMIGTSFVAFSGTAVSFLVTGLSASTVYYFDVFSYNDTGGTYTYLTTSPLEGSQITLTGEPPAQPTDITFSSITDVGMTVAFNTAAGSPTGYIALMNGTGSPTEIPVDGTGYNIGDPLGSTTVAYVGPNASFPVSGLSPSTPYYFDIFSYNGVTGTYNYLTSSPLEGSQTTYAESPTTQPTDISFSSITDGGMTVTFTAAAGAPAGYLALLSASGSPTDLPVNGNGYTAGNPLGSSTIVYFGTDTSFPVSGLSNATLYYFDIFSFNGTTGTYSYLTSSPLEGSQTTHAGPPSGPPSNIGFSSITDVGMTVAYAGAGGATGYLALINGTNSPTEAPVNGTSYTQGDPIGTSSVAFVTSDQNYTVSGLSPSTVYYFDIFSFNGTTGTYHYHTSSPLEGSQTTYAEPPTAQPTNIEFSSISNSGMTVAFTAPATGPATGYLAIISSTGSPSEIPTNGTSYNSGDPIGARTVAFAGNSTSFSVSGLSPSTVYSFDIFSFNGTTGTYHYLANSPLEGSQTTHAEPPSGPPTTIGFSSITDVGMTVTIGGGAGLNGYLALMNDTGSPTEIPADGTGYNAGDPLGSSTVVYMGPNASFSVTGLSPSTTYYFDIFSYNGVTGTYSYLTSSPLEGNRTTLATEPSSQPGNLGFSSISAGGMTVTFDHAPGSPTGYIALFDASGWPGFIPEDGTSYVAGNTFGSSTVAYVGSGNSFSVTGLSYAQYYYWHIFSFNGTTGTINYLTSGVLNGNQPTHPSEPGFPPTSLSFSSVTSSGMDVSFAQAPGVPSGYLVLRKDNSSPSFIPIDGSFYNVGSTLADNSVVAYMGNNTSFGVSGLQAETVYYYDIYAYNEYTTYNYLESTPLEGNQSTLAAEPQYQPNNISFSSVSEVGMTVNFMPAPVPPAGYIALMDGPGGPTLALTDGTSYAPGYTFGSTTVVFVGTGNSFSVTALLSSTSYNFRIYSYNGTAGTINYMADHLFGSRTTLPNEPIGAPTSIGFSSVSESGMNVNFNPAGGVVSGYIALRRLSSSPPDAPVDGAYYNTGNTIGNSTVVQTGNSTGFFDSGLQVETVYSYDIYSYIDNGSGINYLQSSYLQGSQSTLAAEPPFQNGGISFTSISETSITVTISQDGVPPSGYLGLARTGTWPNISPTDGVGNAAGTFIGPNLVAFAGSGNSFTLTGLTPSTYYYFYVYGYNGADGTINYHVNNILSRSQNTLAAEPTAAPTLISFTSVTATGMNVSFVPATGFPSGYVAFRRLVGSPPETPVDGNQYFAGTSIGSSVVAYAGNNTFFNVFGLQAGTAYAYDIYSYSEFNGTYNYYQNSSLTGSRSTLAPEPSFHPGMPLFSAVSESSITVSFTAAPGAPTGYIALMRANNSIFDTPTDGVIHPVESTIGFTKVVYNGSGTSFTVSGLSPSTNYYFQLFSYNGGTGTINYLTGSPSSNNQTTFASQPTSQPSGISFSFVSTNSMTVNLTAAPGSPPAGYIVLRKAGSPPAEIPLDGTQYFTNSNIGTSGTVVAHSGNTSSFFSGSLASGTEYHYRVFSYNGSSGTYNYLETGPLSGSQWTTFPEPIAQPTSISFSNVTETSMTVGLGGAAGLPSGYFGLVRAGSSPTNSPGIVPVDGETYVPGQARGESFVAFLGPGTSFNVTGLSPSTIYYFDVFSYNGVSNQYNYLLTPPTESFTTTLAPEPTTQPTTITFTNLQRNSVTLSWIATGSPAGYVVMRSTGPQADPPIDGVVYSQGSPNVGSMVAYSGTALTFNDTGLLPETKYYYRVYAYSGTTTVVNGRTNLNYKTTQPLLGDVTTPLDTTPPNVTGTVNTSPFVNPGQKTTISIQLTDQESQPTQATLHYRYVAQGGDLIQLPLTLSGANWSVDVPPSSASELGMEYQVVTRNAAGNEGPSPMRLIPVSHTSLPVKYSSFGTKLKSFRIISIPAALELKGLKRIFEDELGTYDEKSWRVYRYESGNTSDVSTKDIEPGKGYWLIVRDDPKKEIQTGPGTSVAAMTTAHYSIPVTEGWNQIGNPYNFNLKWEEVVARNPDLQLRSLKVFNGTDFQKETVLNKMEGGFVYAGRSGNLFFPVVKNTSVNGSRTQETAEEPLDPNGWTVPLTLTQSDLTSSLPGIGMHRDAREDFDRYDDVSMPRFMDYLELNHSKKIHGNAINFDVVPLKDAYTWKFRVESSLDNEEITVSWPETEELIRPDLQLFLLDELENVSVDMRLARSYTFSSARSFKIIYGSEQYLSSELPEGKGKILMVYPNPAREKLAAVVTIPSWNKEFEVSIDLVNALGQSTAVMYSGIMTSGTHTVGWNGFERRPPAGVYFVRMVCNGQVSIQRIVLQ
jgi:hypothetical protein